MEQAAKFGRIVIPTEIAAKPGGPSRHGPSHIVTVPIEQEWHGVGILYARKEGEVVHLRLFYEAHVSQEIKDEVAHRFGVGAIQWEVSA